MVDDAEKERVNQAVSTAEISLMDPGIIFDLRVRMCWSYKTSKIVDAASERSVVINQLIWPTVHPVQWAASLSLSAW